jgi:hypothetical protein
MSEAITWSSADVAAALGHRTHWFWRNRAKLSAAGFPLPLPIVRRYDPAAVRRWISGQAGATPASPVDDVDAWAARLDRRAGELGRQTAGA